MTKTNNAWRYRDKVVLVSGGASGIGRATVEAMAGEGGRIVFSDIQDDAGRAAEEEMRNLGLDVHFELSDSTEDISVRNLIATIDEKFGALDVAVNNVGSLVQGELVEMSIEEMTIDIWNASIKQNMTSCFLGMKYQIEYMKRHGGGAIANTASLAGIRIPGTTPSYIASKAGIIHLTRYAAVRYAEHKIRVNAVAPGMIATPGMLDAFPDEAVRHAFISRYQPGGRLIDPAEIAQAFAWLCSDNARGMTGHTMPVDDGWAAT